MAKSHKRFFYAVSTIAVVIFSFIIMKLVIYVFPDTIILKDFIFGAVILVSYRYIAELIRRRFFSASVGREELFRDVPTFRTAGLLFAFTLIFFPVLFIIITFLDALNYGHDLGVNHLLEKFVRIFPVTDYLRLLIGVPIVVIMASLIYNKLLKWPLDRPNGRRAERNPEVE